MKKTLVLALLGITAATTAFGQGHVLISSYSVEPYNQVWYQATGLAATSPIAGSLEVWYQAGAVGNDSSLVLGATFNINPTLGSAFTPVGGTHGPGGYYDPVVQLVPTTGIYTFQLRASDGAGPISELLSRSALFQWTADSTALPAPTVGSVPGLSIVVPEPSTFALAGLGAAAMLIFRRRN
jgi:hypothetical protein